MKVFPPSAIANLLAANRDTTRVLFRLGRSLADWCSDHILDLSQPLQLRWSLLQFKSDGRTPTAMRGYVSAVSSVHEQVMDNGVHGPVSKHKAVSTIAEHKCVILWYDTSLCGRIFNFGTVEDMTLEFLKRHVAKKVHF